MNKQVIRTRIGERAQAPSGLRKPRHSFATNSTSTPDQIRRGVTNPVCCLKASQRGVSRGVLQREAYGTFLARDIEDETPYTSALKLKLAALVWPEEAPTIELVEDAGTTTAEYKADDHKIEVQAAYPLSWDEIFDDVLFEAFNAQAQARYNTLDAEGNTKLNGNKTTRAYGKEKSDIEYSVNRRYVDSLSDLDIPFCDSPERAQKAIDNRIDDILAERSDAESKDRFAESKHAEQAVLPAKGALGSADLYSYELIEGFEDIGWCSSRMTKQVRAGNWSGCGGTIATSWAAFYNTGFARSALGGGWPKNDAKKKRPKMFYQAIERLLVAAAKAKQDVPADFVGGRAAKVKSWQDVITKLAEFKFTDHQKIVADAAFEG